MPSAAPLLEDAQPLEEPGIARPGRLWRPRRVLATPAALEHAHGRAMLARVEALGLSVARLPSNRLTGLREVDPRRAYAEAKATLALTVASPAKLRLQPIPRRRTGGSTSPRAARPIASTATSRVR